MQLHLCDDPLGLTGFSLRSFLRVDAIHEVPFKSTGGTVELWKASATEGEVLHFLD